MQTHTFFLANKHTLQHSSSPSSLPLRYPFYASSLFSPALTLPPTQTHFPSLCPSPSSPTQARKRQLPELLPQLPLNPRTSFQHLRQDITPDAVSSAPRVSLLRTLLSPRVTLLKSLSFCCSKPALRLASSEREAERERKNDNTHTCPTAGFPRPSYPGRELLD